MYGIVKIGAIDCGEDEELCEEFTVYDVPKILVFTENLADDGDAFRGEKIDHKSISKFATDKMQNFVSVVTESNYESWIERDASKNKVLVFTERKTTAPLFKALSKQYKDKLVFGEVRKSEVALAEKFGIKNFPSWVVITDPFDYTSDTFNEEFKIDQLNKFLNKYAYSSPKVEKKLEVVELTHKKVKNQGICGKKSSNFCIIAFVDDNQDPLVKTLESLLVQYKSDPVTFAYIKKTEEPDIHKQFN